MMKMRVSSLRYFLTGWANELAAAASGLLSSASGGVGLSRFDGEPRIKTTASLHVDKENSQRHKQWRALGKIREQSSSG